MIDAQPRVDDTVKSGVLAHMMAKSFKTFGVVVHLCKGGYGEDAQCLARTIFDSCMIAGTVFIDSTEESAIRFLFSDDVHRIKLWEKVKDHPGYKEEMEERLKNPKPKDEPMEVVQKRVEELKKKFGNSYGNPMKWHGKEKTVYVAEGIGMRKNYETAYDMQSTFVHSMPRSGDAYVRDDGERLWMVYTPSENQIDICLASAMSTFIAIIKWFNDHFKLDFDERIQEVMKQFIELNEKE